MRTLMTGIAAATFALASSAAVSAPGSWISGKEVWLTGSDFKYEEPGIMKETGEMVGIGARAYRPFGNHWMGTVSAEYTIGELDYSGATWGGTPVKTDTDDTVFQADATMGYRIPGAGYVISPYTGVGVRKWDQDLKSTILPDGSAAIGYERGHTYYYFPVGVSFHTDLNPNLRLSIKGEYRYPFKATAYADLPGVSSMDIDGGDGYYLSVRVDRLKQGPFWAELFYSRWSMDDSEMVPFAPDGVNVTGFGYEPKNKTTEYGVKIGFRF